MAMLNELSASKERLLKTFLSDRELVTLITNNEEHPIPAKDLRYKTVFPYSWIDDTVTDASVFLCFDIDIPSTLTVAVKEMDIYVWTFCHYSLMRTDEGTRVDRIANRVDELINGSTDFGFGTLELQGVERINPARDYYGRMLTYRVKDFNRWGKYLNASSTT